MAKFLFLVFSCFLACYESSAQQASLELVNSLKQYYSRGLPYWYLDEAYTRWMKGDKPLVYVFLSRADSVLEPIDDGTYFADTCLSKAMMRARHYDSLGYHTFCYKTYCNSNVLLSRHMLSYESEAIAFGVLHELSHNYFRKDYIRLPYRFEEAACDIIGNYGTLEYARESGAIDTQAVIRQIEVNEALYTRFNIFIGEIDRGIPHASVYGRAIRLLDSLQAGFNSFQRDRFCYTVNNAYLLKNQNYCKYYFLLKKVYMQKRSYKAFIEVLKSIPSGDEKQAEAYLQNMLARKD